jgi:hypothetical protein
LATNTIILVVAAIFLVLCLSTFWWGTRSSAIGRRHMIFVLAWLCAALVVTLIVFSLFPSSTASGKAFGFTLGGAGAFVLAVWLAALWASGQAARRDQHETELFRANELDTRSDARSAPLGKQEIHRYQLVSPAGSSAWVAVITGDIRQVTHADVWVNSENTDMTMSRVHEFSISGIIRYEGARRDRSGRMLDDHVGDALARVVGDRRPVEPGVAIATTSGELERRNNVRYVIHVAAVQGSPGSGFAQIKDVARCVHNALAEAETLDDRQGSVGTVLFPLLGTGQAGADLLSTTGSLLDAAISYLATTTGTRLRGVYFLAYTSAELAACRTFLDACESVTRRTGTVIQ